jgi:hypothetical protein
VTVVQHTLTDAAGGALAGHTVPVRLVGSGFTNSGAAEIIRATYPVTDATGLYSMDLAPQSGIDPAGTHYEVTHPGGEVLSFVVSDAAGPLQLRDLLVSNPAQPSPVVAGASVVDNGDGTATLTWSN